MWNFVTIEMWNNILEFLGSLTKSGIIDGITRVKILFMTARFQTLRKHDIWGELIIMLLSWEAYLMYKKTRKQIMERKIE